MSAGHHTPEDPDKVHDVEVEVGEAPLTTLEVDPLEVDETYVTSSKFMRFFRGVLCQMILLGCISFVDPAMSDAIGYLGGGGFSSPYLANLASSLGYACSSIMALFGGPFINKLGIKYSCMISAACYALGGSSYYVMARYGNQAYLLSAKTIQGFTNALLYVGESTAMLSYPTAQDRGKYLGIWTSMRNAGSIVGGAINFGNNHTNSSAGGIAWSTYLIFVGFEASGLIFASLLTQTKKVRRPDGTRVPTSVDRSWRAEFVALWRHIQNPRTWLIFMPSFYSFFYGGTYSTYLSLHFSVRARALSSLITPTCTSITVLAYGAFLDNKRWSQRKRAVLGFLIWLIPQAACFIWTGINYGRWGNNSAAYHAYDYINDKGAWAVAYLPYFIIFVTGYWCQLYLYWVLGTFSTDVKSSSRTGGLFRAFESAGSAVTYAINSAATDKKIPLYVNSSLLAATIPCIIALIRMVPDAPSAVDDLVEDAQTVEATTKAE